MGGKSSKGLRGRDYSSYGSANSSSSWNQYGYPPASSYPSPQPDPYWTQQRHHAPAPNPSYPYESHMPPQQPHKRLDRKYSRIADNYQTLDQVTAALAQAGLESSNLIVGIDFTKSNEWTGARSFNRRSLHDIGNVQNPYEQAISIIGRTMSAFDEDNLIPCFGFGDASTHDQDVFSFFPEERFCNGFEEVLTRYKEIVPNLRLAGPTSFAPVIEMAITIVEQGGGQYHVLLIIADGQVTRSVDTHHGQLSPQERRTIDAIVKASEYPLSIILVGVGDGPWEMMREFDDNIPARAFDNFQFVNFTEIMSKNVSQSRKEAEFALAALMEIPSQYKATIELGLLGNHHRGNAPERVPLPPPLYGQTSSSKSKASRSSSFQQHVPSYPAYDTPVSGYETKAERASSSYDTPVSGYETTAERASSSSSVYDNQVCPICLTNPKNMAFGCGHQTCCDCGEDLQVCPICRGPIQARIRLY
ncbi:PREDICTED: E3 ubiquitin-protein ligase RGLG2-like isoform X1 [Populus euphratica]|uniref:E3 ubiquitin-protein ligase RGLG2-like isoform X1 n=1 Tax=Populus euphratica TaxID=75702 RepID=A0AAJ6XWX9_POPEU|nr:PREDICTED: E3 ubiquitin-protein ligase RGLG2-like isoform X1 [Populus euphratica]XP_011034032.1 PREDICTED: E3 ubiquitin-protein ligase RGLG2-like isoform X1 [Populus euphratica]